MKVFEKGYKVNFVDKNNVFVGYDLEQGCCEYADWFLSEQEETKVHDDNGEHKELKKDYNLDDYIFDTNYFVKYGTNYFEKYGGEYFDSGGLVRFKLISLNKPELYLHLFNVHNGYYSHGFEAKIQDKIWIDDTL